MTLYKRLGLLGLASRIRELGDSLLSDGINIYTLSGIDFNPRWFGIYYLLLQHKEMSITDIANELGQSHPAIIKIVSPMNQAGIVKSHKNNKDGRKRIIALTEKGAALQEKLEPVWIALNEALHEMFQHLNIDIIGIIDRIEAETCQESVSKRFHRKYKSHFLKNITIVPYSDEYATYFRTLNEEWLDEWFEVEPCDREMLDHPEKIFSDNGDIFFAMYGNYPVGTIALIKNQNELFEIAKMAVKKDFRNHGIGRLLLKHCLNNLRVRGGNTVFLRTSPHLIAANHLYKSLGFQETSHISCGEYRRQTIVLWMKLET